MDRIPFEQLPRNVKNAVITLFSAWGFFVLAQAFFYGRISFILSTLGIFCCVIVYSFKNWGRIVCILLNFFMVAASLVNLYHSGTEGTMAIGPTIIALGNIILFSAATYFLLNRETALFFKRKNQQGGRRDMT